MFTAAELIEIRDALEDRLELAKDAQYSETSEDAIIGARAYVEEVEALIAKVDAEFEKARMAE